MKRNPTTERANSEGECRFSHENSDASTSRRALNVSRLGAVSLLSGMCLLGILGCESMNRSENVRHGHTEYALEDQNMTETWSAAASDVSVPNEICVVAKKPVNDSENISRGQDKDVSSSSFTQRIKNIFHPNYHEENEEDVLLRESARSGVPYSASSNSTSVPMNDGRRTTYVASDVHSQSEGSSKGNFWSKLFHTSSKTDVDDSINYRSEPSDSIGNEMARRSRATSQFGTTLKIGSKKRTSSKVETSSVVDSFDPSQYLPSSRDVAKYYEPSGQRRVQASNVGLGGNVASVADNVGQVPRRSRSSELAAISASEEHSYHSQSYAPTRTPNTVQSVYSSERRSSQGNASNPQVSDGRLGNMSLSPGMPADPSSVSSRVHMLGSVRPVPDATSLADQQKSVGLVSYMERTRGRNHELRLDPNSLFGWSSETNALLSDTFEVSYSTDGQELSNVDSEFAASLGAKKRYSWFDSNQDTQEPVSLASTNENPGIEISRLSSESETNASSESVSTIVSDLENSNESEQIDVVVDEEQTNESLEETAPEGVVSEELSLDEIFDSMASKSDSSTEAEVAQVESDVATALPEQVLNDDPVETPLKQSDATPAEYVQTVPLNAEHSDPIDDFPTAPDKLLSDQSAELETSVVVPESVDERKTENVATPLTQEEIAWVEHIKNAIESLLAEREQIKSRGGDVHGCDARLRLLYLVIGEYDRSIQEIQEDSDPLKVFWEKECRGLGVLLHNKLEEIDPSFVAERLRSGLDSFSGLCSVKINKATLVNAPSCYGLYEEHKGTYAQGDVVYAYTELDFVVSKETREGYEIDVECRWRLLDSDRKEIVPFEVQRCSNVSETKLRDVVLNVSVPLPADAASGIYTLELEVVDMNAEVPIPAVKKIEVSVSNVQNDETSSP